jgi:hypothetical protein
MIKTIYILWFQGFNNAPQIVSACIRSWKHYNKDWNIVLLDNSNLNKYVDMNEIYSIVDKKNIKPCHLSDIIRCKLLLKYGGVWADATLFCNKPLNNWLSNFIKKSGFFAFKKPTSDKMLSNWFLYSDKENNYIIQKWHDATCEYYKKNGFAKTYFVHHYIFEDIYKNDQKFKELWNITPNFPSSGLGPHYIQNMGIFNNLTSESKYFIDRKVSPVYKLTYKTPFIRNNFSNFNYLYSTISKKL